jgi:hypothetical protein
MTEARANMTMVCKVFCSAAASRSPTNEALPVLTTPRKI